YYLAMMQAVDLLAAVAGGFNTGYFLLYRSPLRRRWLAARVLAVVNLGIAAQGLHALASGGGPPAARLLLGVGAGLMGLFILRQLLAGRAG
ncbi:MAG: hypothetical protein AAB270_03530, partial [Chloroflexota bacterium]